MRWLVLETGGVYVGKCGGKRRIVSINESLDEAVEPSTVTFKTIEAAPARRPALRAEEVGTEHTVKRRWFLRWVDRDANGEPKGGV